MAGEFAFSIYLNVCSAQQVAFATPKRRSPAEGRVPSHVAEVSGLSVDPACQRQQHGWHRSYSRV